MASSPHREQVSPRLALTGIDPPGSILWRIFKVLVPASVLTLLFSEIVLIFACYFAVWYFESKAAPAAGSASPDRQGHPNRQENLDRQENPDRQDCPVP